MVSNVTTLPTRPAPKPATAAPTVWGLSSRQLHDAFWRSKGVQVVRRGQRQRLQKGADLFLLAEPEQLVLFDIAQISERLTWHHAAVTRLRLIEEGPQRYSEHVLANERGFVQRIERRYRPRVQQCSRVMLTTLRRAAAIWMSAKSGREGWDRVRRAVPWPRVDHWKVVGRSFTAGAGDDDRRLINRLVEQWHHPDQVIAGVEELEPGVWHVAGEDVEAGMVRVGPVWLGCGAGNGKAKAGASIIIGPAWIEDDDDTPLSVDPESPDRLRDIIDVEFPQSRHVAVFIRPGETRTAYLAVKRLFDIVASVAALIVLAPLMLMVALLILAESGRPVFFGHLRQGKNGRLFRCWKFRTMHRDAQRVAREAGLAAQNICDGPQVYIQNDPRVTRLGRVLRLANLDELPQFWNVLIGQMSLVGPRPSPDDENQYCPAWRDLRLSVRPGITGLWQLNRTREPGEDFQEWIKYDIEYVHRAGFWFDLAILFRTAWILLIRSIKRCD